MTMVHIPFATWMSWTPKERRQVTEYYAQLGVRWMLDLTKHTDIASEIEKDYDEYREDMSIGGRPYNVEP